MAQDLKSQIKEIKDPSCLECQNPLPHSHCKCPYCGNPDCVCEFIKFDRR